MKGSDDVYKVEVKQQSFRGGYTHTETLTGNIPDYELLTSLMGILPEIFNDIEITVIPNNHDDENEEEN